MKISEFYNEFSQLYDEKKKNLVWENNRYNFLNLWNKSLKEKLSIAEIDKIVRILDKHGKGSTSDDDAVANVMVPQGAWYKMFSNFFEQNELRDAINSILSINDDKIIITKINELIQLNSPYKNHLTGESGSAINAFLAIKNPFKNLSVVSLIDRYKVLDFLNIEYGNLKIESIGAQIIETNKLIMAYFEREDISSNARTVTSFLYSKDIINLWKIHSEPQSELPTFSNSEFPLILSSEMKYLNTKCNNNWAITQKSKFNIRIHCGNFIIFSTHKNEIWLSIDSQDTESLNNLDFWKWDNKDYPTYKKSGLNAKNGYFKGNFTEWERIKEYHYNFIDRIIEKNSKLKKNTIKDNNCELILEISADISLPSYEISNDNFKTTHNHFNLIDTSNFGATEKEALIKARKGQNIFRENLLGRDKVCSICGLDIQELLRASHIKPWSEFNSGDKERLDIENGLLLCGNHDLLFDRFLISFSDDGSLLYSFKIKKYLLKLNLDVNKKIKLSDKQRIYMKWHRDKFLKREISN